MIKMRCGLYVTKGANFHLLKLELGEAPTPTNKQDIYMSSIFMLTLIVWQGQTYRYGWYSFGHISFEQ